MPGAGLAGRTLHLFFHDALRLLGFVALNSEARCKASHGERAEVIWEDDPAKFQPRLPKKRHPFDIV